MTTKVLIAVIFLGMAFSASAQTAHRCVGNDGKVSYQGLPCADKETASIIKLAEQAERPSTVVQDCSIAKLNTQYSDDYSFLIIFAGCWNKAVTAYRDLRSQCIKPEETGFTASTIAKDYARCTKKNIPEVNRKARAINNLKGWRSMLKQRLKENDIFIEDW